MTNKRDRVRAQVKSRWYYAFWGTATVAVVAGQVYVGTSYRAMAKSMNRWFDEAIEILLDRQRSQPQIQERYEPLVPPPYGDFRDYGNGVVYL
jgi:hypothetical protein